MRNTAQTIRKLRIVLVVIVCSFASISFAMSSISGRLHTAKGAENIDTPEATETIGTAAKLDESVIRTYLAPLGANQQPSSTKREHFDCSEQIFTVVELSQYPIGKHHLAVKWIDPGRGVREHTQYPFGVGKSGQTKLYAWLELTRSAGAGLVAWMNPAAGLEEFVGTWDVEIKIDNRLVATRQFEVSC
jgi:hypothetical protein